MLIDLLVNTFLVLLIVSTVLGIVFVLAFIAVVVGAVIREIRKNNEDRGQ
ncbi:hypothetical protein [uncultured Ligilactobacillus sp.]|nr:hypothetical protein [uncultured Ligilactobacillus sp.]